MGHLKPNELRMRRQLRADRGSVGTIEVLFILPTLLLTFAFMALFGTTAFTWHAAKQSVNEGVREGALLLQNSGTNVTEAVDSVETFLDKQTGPGQRFASSGTPHCSLQNVAGARVRLLRCSVDVQLNIPLVAALSAANPTFEMRSSNVVEEL